MNRVDRGEEIAHAVVLVGEAPVEAAVRAGDVAVQAGGELQGDFHGGSLR